MCVHVCQLMEEAAAEDGKIAVHCHAGLGRTGCAPSSALLIQENA